MADDQVVTNIVARADFSDLIANVHRTTTALAAMQQQLGNSNKVLTSQISSVNRAFGETLRSTGQFSSHFVSLASEVDTFGKRLDGGKLKLRDYFSTLQTHTRTSGGLIRQLAQQQVQLQNAIVQPLGKNAQGLQQFSVHIPAGLDAIKNKGALARQEMQILNKVMQEGAGQLINWGKNTQWAGRQLTVGLTVPIVAFGAAASKAFREADAELVRLTKVYGGLAATSSAELSKVRADVSKTATELAKAYGASFKDTIALAADIAATGKQGNELLKSTQETTRLSILGEVDRQDAMKTTLALQSAFKQNTTELAESINFLNAVENQTSTTLQDLTEAIPKAGPVIKGLGGDVQDLSLFLVAMKEGGINATEGANALKSALASIINPTKVAKGMFQDMGISLEGIVNGNAGDVKGMIFELQAALDKLDPLKKQQAIEQLFGKFQFARMSALFENLGKQGSQTLQVMDLMKASTAELAGIADRELKQVTESASGKYRRAVEGLKADLAVMGEEFLKVQTFFVNMVSGIVKFVNALPGPIKSVLTFLAGLTAVAGPLIMLTGVLSNFLGYVIKGAFHLKALFKGGEGWKLLTPDILAAQKAGTLIEKTFYSDAKAALALADALQVLSAGMTSIQSKMNSGVVSVKPMLSTVAGSIIIPPGGRGPGGGGGGVGRVVDPQNPLVGPAGTRASAHMIPRSGMTQSERAAQTIHSFLPAPIPVNQAIGANPQIYATGDLPAVPGLSTIVGKSGAVSTGVVAAEAAKWQAMVGALSMMTKQEVAQMKTQMSTTGAVSSEFTQAFGSLMPQMTSIAENAAKQSAIIVAEAKAGTISVTTARQRIIQLNAQVEALMVQATTGTAGSLGRTAVLTGVPTLDQPVVDPKTGKSNMRELFKKGGTRSFIDDLARRIGVRTWGAGYSTHTTIPTRLNSGGPVYLSGGSRDPIVPGPSVDKDVVPALLTPGEFVVNRRATMANLPLLQAINGRGSRGPRYNDGTDRAIAAGVNITNEEMKILNPGFRGNLPVYRAKGGGGTYNGSITDPAIIAKYPHLVDPKTGLIGLQQINSALAAPGVRGLPAEVMLASIDSAAKASGVRNSAEQLLNSLAKSGVISVAEAASISDEIHSRYSQVIGSRIEGVSDRRNPFWAVSNRIISSRLAGNADALAVWSDFSQSITHHTGAGRRSTTALSLKFKTPSGVVVDVGRLKGSRSAGTAFLHSSVPKPLIDRMATKNLFIKEVISRALSSRFMRRNNGGMIPGYNNGGMIGNPNDIVARGYNNSNFPVSSTTGRPISLAEWSAANSNALSQPTLYSQMLESGEISLPASTQSATKTPSRAARFGLGAARFGGSIGGWTAGSMLTSKITGGNQLLDMLGGMAGAAATDAAISKLTSRVTGLGQAAGKTSSLANGMKSTLSLVAKLPGPLKVLAVVAGVAVAVKAVNDKIEEHKRIVSLGFGVSEQSAKKLGLSYETAGNQIEAYRKKKELADAANATKLYSTSKLSGPGMNITGPELEKLKEQVQKDMPDEIKMLDGLNDDEVAARITSIKAGYVGLGMSVENANELIYAMLLNSNKSSQALALLGDEGFSRISDKASAASAAMKTFADALKSGDFDQIGIAFQTGVNVLDSYVNSLVGTDAKTKEVTTSAEAYKKVLDQLNNRPAGDLAIGQEGYDSIVKSDAVMARYISKTDTLAGAWAKVKLSTSGLQLDLKNMASQTAEALSVVIAAQKEALSAVDGPFGSLAKKIALLSKNTQDSVIKNANKTKEALQAEIKLRQKNIEKIKDEADARKQALDEELSSQDFLTEIKKKQMEYSEALAAGDMAKAAQTQLDIQSLTGSRQVELAKNSIDKKADSDIKKQQQAIDKLTDAIDTLGKNTDKQLAGVEKAQQDAAKYQLLMDRLVTLANSIQDGTSAEEDRAAKVLAQDLTAAGFKDIADKYLVKTQGFPLKGATGISDYTSLKTLASDKFKFEAGKLTVTDVETRDAIKALEKSMKPTALPKVALTMKGTTAPLQTDNGVITPAPGQRFINKDQVEWDLKKAGQKFEAGVKFTDASGVSWVIDEVIKTKKDGPENIAVISRYNMAAGGSIKNFRPGGNVSGPGTSTSDSIPAMLSDGEYVIKADSVKKYGMETFDALNAGKFANGGPANTSAMITPSIPYYMKDGGIMDGIRGGYRFFENAMKNGKNPASSILMDLIRQSGYLGQIGLSSLTKGMIPKPTKMQDKSFQEFTGVPALYRSLSGKTSESPLSLETGNKQAGKWMDYLGAASMFMPFKGGKSLGKVSTPPVVPLKTLDNFGSDFIVGNYASPGTGITSSSIFNLPHSQMGPRWVGGEASLSHNPLIAETTIDSVFGLPGSNKTGLFGSALLEAMARGNKLVLSPDRSVHAEKFASILSNKNLKDLIRIPKREEATIDGIGPMPWAYSQSEGARKALEMGLNPYVSGFHNPKSFVPLHPDQISAAGQASKLVLGSKDIDLKMLEDLLQQYISSGKKGFANGGQVGASIVSAPSVPYYMNMGGMIPGYHKGGPVGHRHGRNLPSTQSQNVAAPTSTKWTKLDGKKHYVFDKLSGTFGRSVMETKGMTLEQLNARYVDLGVYTESESTNKNTYSGGPQSYNSAIGAGLFQGFSVPWLEFLGAKGVMQTANKIFQGGKNKAANAAFGSTPNNYDYLTAALLPLNFVASGEKAAVTAVAKSPSLVSRLTKSGTKGLSYLGSLGKKGMASALSKLGTFTAKSKFEKTYGKYVSSPLQEAKDIVKHAKTSTMAIRMTEQFALLASKGLKAEDIYHTLPDGKLWIHPNVERFLPPGFERNAVNNLWSSAGHTIRLPEKEILAYYEKELIQHSKKVRAAKTYLTAPSSYISRIAQMGKNATPFQQGLLSKINNVKGVIPGISGKIKSFFADKKLGVQFEKASNMGYGDPAKDDMMKIFGGDAFKYSGDTLSEHATKIITTYDKHVASIEMQKKIIQLMRSSKSSFQETIKSPEVLDLAQRAGIEPNYIQNTLGSIGRYITPEGVVSTDYIKDFAKELMQLKNVKTGAQQYLSSPLSFISRFKESRAAGKATQAAGFGKYSSGPVLNAVVNSSFIPKPLKNLFEVYAGRTRSGRDNLGSSENMLHPLEVPIDHARAYGPGTYFARTPKFSEQIFKGFGDNVYKMKLDAKAFIKVIKSKGFIEEENIYKIIEDMGFDPKSLGGMTWDHPVVQKLMGEGYLGLKHKQAYTSWLTGLPGFNLRPTKQITFGIKNFNYQDLLESTLKGTPKAPLGQLASYITQRVKDYTSPERKANGGMVGSGYNIPKFESGINNVPADMLAMLHKNEAVVPANMNPFNPNAQSYSQPSVSYNIAPVINAAPGMDEQAIANMATRQVLAEIKVLDSRNNASIGRPGTRIVGK